MDGTMKIITQKKGKKSKTREGFKMKKLMFSIAILIGCMSIVNNAFARVDSNTNRYICDRWNSSQEVSSFNGLSKGGVR